jgi:hypothetical protein
MLSFSTDGDKRRREFPYTVLRSLFQKKFDCLIHPFVVLHLSKLEAVERSHSESRLVGIKQVAMGLVLDGDVTFEEP